MGFLKAKSVVGLDIDTAEIRAVELGGSIQSPNLVKYGRIPLPDGAVREGMISEQEKVQEALDRLWYDAGFSSRDVILGVSNQGVLVRFATFPKVASAKVDKLIRYQAQEHIPFPLSSVVLDYIIVGETASDTEQFLEVLLVAGKRDIIDSFLEVVTAADLKVKDIDISSLALQRFISSADSKETAAVVNIGDELSSILVVDKDNPRFARTIPTGLKAAEGVFNCSISEIVPAEPERKSVWAEDAVSAWSLTLAGEINTSLSYYQNQQNVAAINRVFLSGRGARINGLAGKLQDSLELPVLVIQPFEGISVPVKHEKIKSTAQDFAVSAALALRGLEV
ncbi:MAG: type IV pilus assembly protein PilM [Thermacetogeniaceae bacterium]